MESGDPILVNANVTILAFPEISTLDLRFVADFVLLMRWVRKEPGFGHGFSIG